jgi:YHS domain-containing protein
MAACAATPGKVSQTRPVTELNLRQGVALKGYDPIAYFVDKMPTVGNPAISYQWQGATWLFATDEHREAFKADPAQYAPQYGGYCAFAVSRGTTADADPNQWAIVDGKLYVNNNAFAKTLWDQDRPGNIVAGDTNWPLIPKQPLVAAER